MTIIVELFRNGERLAFSSKLVSLPNGTGVVSTSSPDETLVARVTYRHLPPDAAPRSIESLLSEATDEQLMDELRSRLARPEYGADD